MTFPGLHERIETPLNVNEAQPMPYTKINCQYQLTCLLTYNIFNGSYFYLRDSLLINNFKVHVQSKPGFYTLLNSMIEITGQCAGA